MPVRAVALEDIDWIVGVLQRRRERLVPLAPVFWNPAPDASVLHRSFIEHLLFEAGGSGYRTERSVLVAAPRRAGWVVDDAYVPGSHWALGDGRDLWNGLDGDHHGAPVRFICPTYERDRAAFAQAVGLSISESWWLLELEGSSGDADVEVLLPGCKAITVAAPPIYAPPGPILFLPALSNAQAALPAAVEQARVRGCAAVVVNQAEGDTELAELVADLRFRRHCDYFTGAINSI